MNIGACDYKSNRGIVAALGDKSVHQAWGCQPWGWGQQLGEGRHFSGLACLSLWLFFFFFFSVACLSWCDSASVSVWPLAGLPAWHSVLPSVPAPGPQKHRGRCHAASCWCSPWRDSDAHAGDQRGGWGLREEAALSAGRSKTPLWALASSGPLFLSFAFFSIFPQGSPILKTEPQPLPRIPTPSSYHHSFLHLCRFGPLPPIPSLVPK